MYLWVEERHSRPVKCQLTHPGQRWADGKHPCYLICPQNRQLHLHLTTWHPGHTENKEGSQVSTCLSLIANCKFMRTGFTGVMWHFISTTHNAHLAYIRLPCDYNPHIFLRMLFHMYMYLGHFPVASVHSRPGKYSFVFIIVSPTLLLLLASSLSFLGVGFGGLHCPGSF